MFTTAAMRRALFAAALSGTAAFGQDPAPLPRPPLQPMPKEFKVPQPKLGVPEGTPVAQESPPKRSYQTDPLPPERRYGTPPELRETPRTLPQPPSVVGAQAATELTEKTHVSGKVFRVDKDRVVVQTAEGGQLVLYVDPDTRFLRHEAAGLADLVPGTPFDAVFARRGDRLWITVIDMGPSAPARTVAVPPVPPVSPAPVAPVVVPAAPVVPLAPTAYASEIVRIVGPQEIIVRNAAGQEFPVLLTDQTLYELGGTGTFRDLRPGLRIRIDDELRAERHFARRILGIER
jgi:hypothetical protein